MEDISRKEFLMHLLVYWSQIILCCFQDPVGHGLTAQFNTFSVNLLLLTVQGDAHNELLMYDMGNGLRCGKAAGNDVLLPGRFYNRSFTAFVGVFAAVLTGVGIVVDILMNNGLGRNDLQGPDNFLANLSHSFTALGANEVLTLQTVFCLLGGNTLRNVVQGIFMLLVPLVGCHDSGIFFCFLVSSREHLGFIEQETQLFSEGVFALLGGRTELLVLGKAQCFHEQIHTTFKLRDFLSLSLEFLVFRAGNGDHFPVTYLVQFCLIHVNIIAYFLESTEKTNVSHTISRPKTGL